MPRIRKVSRVISLSWVEILEGFYNLKKAQGLAPRTLHDYDVVVKRLFSKSQDAWDGNSLRNAVLAYLAQDGIAPATYNIRLRYLRSFFTWCVDEGHLVENPTKGLKCRKDSGRVVELPHETLKALLDLPDTSTFSGLRDRAMFLLALDTGIRPGEALRLKLRDVDTHKYLVTIPDGIAKTRTARTLPITSTTAEAIDVLIKVRLENWYDEVPVFCTFEGTEMNVSTWGQRLAEYSIKLGRKIRPYDLRHSFAVIYLRNGGNAFGLQMTLGHTNMQMTKRYVNLTSSDLAYSHQSASPVNMLVGKKRKRATTA